MGRASQKNSTDVLRPALPGKMRKFFRQYLLTSTLPSLYHWPPQYAARFSPASGHTTRRGHAQRIRNVDRTASSPAGYTLRMRIGDGWDVDIYKTMVLAVEEDAMATVAA